MSADVLRDLVRAKAVFQLRAIEAVIHGPAICGRLPKGEDAPKSAAECEASQNGARSAIAQPSSQPSVPRKS